MWQCRCVMWIINCALKMQCNPRVSLGGNKLVSNGWIKTDHRVLQKIYVVWYSFCILSRIFAWAFLKWSNFLSIDPVPPKTKIICFSFQTMKNDSVWRKVFQRYITIPNLSVNIIGVLFFNLISIVKKLHWKFKSFFTDELKIPEQRFNTVYAPIYF